MRVSWNQKSHYSQVAPFAPILGLCVLLLGSSAFGQQPAAGDTESKSESKKVDVESLKKQYWLNAPGMDLNVVQNRTYTKAWKFSFETGVGTFSGDPFVNSFMYGAKLGFFFGEYLGLHALYWKISSNTNNAYDTLKAATTQTSNNSGYASDSNFMQSLAGGELSWSLLYGKLSILGKAIIHFDLLLLGGAGVLNANTRATKGEQSFSTTAYWPGISQQIYFTPWLALRGDYRMIIYKEDVVESNKAETMGNLIKTQTTYAPTFTIGLSLLFL